MSTKLSQDIHYAWRSLGRNRISSAGIILTTAIIVSASACIFSVLYGLFFRPLPLNDSDRLVMLWESNRETGQSHLPVMDAAYPEYRQKLSTFEGLGAFIPYDASAHPIRDSATDERVKMALATPELFRLLDVSPKIGRTFSDAETEPRASPVAVLSQRFWGRRFGGDPHVVGKSLTLNEYGERIQYTIVGVMPPGFEFPSPLFRDAPDFWVCMTRTPIGRFVPGNHFFTIGKRKQTCSLAAVQADLNLVAARIAVEQPRFYSSQSIQAVPLRAESLRDARSIAEALIAAFLLVTCVGSANIVHLVMARATSRTREDSIRLTLGATRWDLLRLTSAEFGIPIFLGGALGLRVAAWGLAALPAVLPPELNVSRMEALALDWPVVLLTSCACIIGALTLGLILSRQFGTGGVGSGLHGGPAISIARSELLHRPGSMILICEVALAFALLAGAFVMLQSVWRLLDEGARTNPGRLLSLDVLFPNDIQFDSATTRAKYANFLLNASALQGVQAVALADSFPLAEFPQEFTLGRGSGIAGAKQYAEMHIVTPGYSEIVGLRVTAGRWLADSDGEKSMPVVVINEAMARGGLWAGQPLGKHLRNSSHGSAEWPEEWEVVGIVREPKRFGSGHAAPPAVYFPFSQATTRNLTILARTDVNARRVASSVRDEALRMLPGKVTIDRLQTGTDIVSESTARSSFVATQLTALALVALALASIGVYSIVSFYSSQRTHEIAVRMAVGGSRGQVMWLIVSQTAILVGIGAAGGCILAAALVRTLSSFRYDARPMDSYLYLVTAAIFGTVGLVASYAVARRVTDIDPAQVLRAQ